MTTWRSLDPGSREPRRLSELLDPVTKRLGGPPPGVFAAIFSRWDALVGPDIAAHAQPVSLHRGVLVLGVDHSMWAAQLRYMTAQLLTRIADDTGSSEVEEIHVRVTGAEGARPAANSRRSGPR